MTDIELSLELGLEAREFSRSFGKSLTQFVEERRVAIRWHFRFSVSVQENHGLERIEVRDDGRGVERDDARVMGKPHYTSKLRSGDDLTRLETYGFRGEALSKTRRQPLISA